MAGVCNAVSPGSTIRREYPLSHMFYTSSWRNKESSFQLRGFIIHVRVLNQIFLLFYVTHVTVSKYGAIEYSHCTDVLR